MSTQRFIVSILAIAGVIATFLPWFRVEMVGDLSGVSTSGWFTFIMFIIILFLCVRRNTTYDMSYGNTWAVSVLGIAAGIVVLWRIFDIYFAQDTTLELSGRLSGINGEQIVLRYGAWIVMVAGLVTPLAAFLFRRPRLKKGSEI